ncbi:hypothetical protein BIFGAL_02749 [Bifidobacterium gallicum DSM 20093 = LMG 11596]|uniref:Uncharacterized protein n=1 Tax=Bifidobacterium gallicum DSM 20093 = LMG 11596 TaxID=561180 RepID=D1NSJ2_9BIFI|nr:hypothetical protein BIFGAL_02749 [Bifidobacterium gallicum DSM 20093 = LMG 11596]
MDLVVLWAALVVFAVFVTLMQFGVLGAQRASNAVSYFTPEPWISFAWIAVFALLALWAIRLGNAKRRPHPVLRTPLSMITLVAVLIALCSIGWVVCWHVGNAPGAVLCIIAMTLLSWQEGRMAVHHDSSHWAKWAFEVLGAWLLVETVIDIFRMVTSFMAVDGVVSAVAQSIFTMILAALLLGVSCALKAKRHVWLFGVVSVWSLLAIAFRLMSVSKVTAIVVIVLITLAVLYMVVPWEPVSTILAKRDAAHQDTSAEDHDNDHEMDASADTDTASTTPSLTPPTPPAQANDIQAATSQQE